jgi:NADH-quinone oxidoreductase subunit H
MASVLLLVSSAQAQTTTGGIALNQFDPAPAGDRFFSVPSPHAEGHLVPRAVALIDYAHEPLVVTDGVNSGAIVAAQDGDWGLFNWYWLPHFPMVFLFFISALAETNRPPFDLPEAESELVAGFMVEYSSTPYLLFMAGEYIAIFLMCALMSLLFFGGWLSPIPGLPDGWWWMVAKMWLFFFMFAMVKAIVPRYRYDQLMRIGWKVFLPLSLGWVVLVAFLAKFEVFGGFWARWAVGG